MLTDTVTYGSTYDISVRAKDADGVDIVLDDTWTAAFKITKARLNGPLVEEIVPTIAEGVVSCSIDTGESPYAAGVYVYDFRLTDSAGNDFWTSPVELTLEDRNAEAS